MAPILGRPRTRGKTRSPQRRRLSFILWHDHVAAPLARPPCPPAPLRPDWHCGAGGGRGARLRGDAPPAAHPPPPAPALAGGRARRARGSGGQPGGRAGGGGPPPPAPTA